MVVRTRFAPSPTGFLHVGGVRTALFCWLFARHHQGKYILRIEDTDRERSTQESVQAILDGLHWLAIDHDEGPFFQTQRYDRYNQVITQLLESGHAYRCTCSKERLEQLRETQMAAKQKPRYDGHCRDAGYQDTGEPYVIRFRNPIDGVVAFDDQVYGSIQIQNSELDDLIIARSDGNPTYNLTVVVDDWDMEITHVIRGDDHINNTPRQINILKALGAQIPTYAHLPMILGSDGKRLSKRHGAVSVLQFREEGILPHALLNYLVRLGWSHGDQEIFSVEEMIRLFDLSTVSKGTAIFNYEKLYWLNQHYQKNDPPNFVAKHLSWYFEQGGIDVTQGPSLDRLIALQAERCKTLAEMFEKSRYFYLDEISHDETARAKQLTAALAEPLTMLRNKLLALTTWEEAQMHQIIIETAEHFNLTLGKLAQPLRVALTGSTVSPSIDVTLYLIGQQRAVQRLDWALAYIQQRVA